MGRISDFFHMGVDTEIDVDIDTDFNFDTDFDVDTDISVDVEVPALPVSPLKPIVITTFVTVFGGIGMICTINGLSQPSATVIALISGAAAAFLLYRFIIVPIYRAQNTSAISQKELRGALAKVTLAINGSMFGKISYTSKGNTYSAPARSIDGEDIERGVPVVIINIEKNTFYVKRIKGGY
jgi:membrane-bound ClpP family serine protease